MATVRLDISYLGSDFAGWARQPGLRTVQGELENALETVLGEPVTLTVAGRTDAGVHASGQVASFETEPTPPSDLARRLNGVGPADIGIAAATVVDDGFDARRSARSRTYYYRVLASPAPSPFEQQRAWWWPYRFDPGLARRCAEAVRGIHDFTAFTPTETDHVRFEREIFRSEWLPQAVPGSESDAEGPKVPPPIPGRGSEGPSLSVSTGPSGSEEMGGNIWCYWIEADAFMRTMVRVLVGTMLEVASGRRPPDSFEALLRGAPRSAAGQTAPAHGLYLAAVSY
jgi:tRNA pseudouridine38-40 synthase